MLHFLRISIGLAALLAATSTAIAGDFPHALWVDGDQAVEKPKPKPSGSPAIVWDQAGVSQFNGAFSAAASQPVDTHIVQITRPFCAPCIQQWDAGQRELTPHGWRFGPAGHFRQEINPNVPTPQYQLRQGGRVLQQWPSGAKWAEMSNALRKALDDPVAASGEQPVGFVSLGTLPARKEVAAYLDMMRPILGNGGSLKTTYTRNGHLAPLQLPEMSGMSVIIPESAELTWTMPGEAVVINSSKPLIVQTGGWLAGSIRISGLTIGRDRITPAVQGLPDPHITITD